MQALLYTRSFPIFPVFSAKFGSNSFDSELLDAKAGRVPPEETWSSHDFYDENL